MALDVRPADALDGNNSLQRTAVTASAVGLSCVGFLGMCADQVWTDSPAAAFSSTWHVPRANIVEQSRPAGWREQPRTHATSARAGAILASTLVPVLVGSTHVNASRRRRACQIARRAATVVAPDEKVVGIDLGTTNSVIAAVEAGVPTIIPNHEGERVTPSVVAFTKEGELLVGRAAKRQAVMNPHSTFHSVKRFVGRTHSEVEKDVELFSYKVLDDAGKVKLDCPAVGRSLAPEEVSAHVLRKLRQDAIEHLQVKIEKAVITVPAYFNDAQRQATQHAGKIAGLEVLRIASEPTMAALAYGLDRKNWSRLLVLDLGGGTFDVSVLEVGDGVLEVVSTAGDTELGGNDFDHRIMDWLTYNFYQEHGIDLRTDKQAMQRLAEAAELAKMELSSSREARISVPFIAGAEDGPKHIDVTLDRDQFEEICKDLIDRLGLPILQALADGKVRKKGMNSITEVVLVGGSSRMPALSRIMEDIVGPRPVNSAVNPEEVVAIGAAVQASMIAGEVNDIMLIDVTPLTLGVETDGGVFSSVVERNTAIPVRQKRFFTTSADCQDEIEVKVYQGERPLAKDNKLLGSFRLENLPPAPAGVAKIEVTFEISIDGVLTVSAKDWASRQVEAITITGSSTLDDEEVEGILRVAEANWENDENRKERVELRYKATSLLKTAEHHLAELGSKSPEDQRQTTLAAVNALKSAVGSVEEEGDHAPVKSAVEDLEYELMILGQRIFGKQVAPDNRPGPARPRPPGGVAGGGEAL